ncbi:MAG: M16 family metallopeptidase [Bdellovibrionia bacterium]
MNKFKKSVLKNGIRVLTEEHPGSRAVSVGIWILSGTRDEESRVAGISHFLEHMVFKGTKSRSAYQIAKSLEALGGELNAYTTREYTCYHAIVLKDHLDEAMDVLADLVCNMKISQKDFKLEQGVILQEIAMSDDNQEDIIYDIFFDKVYGKHPLGRPILGTVKSVAQMTQKAVVNHYNTIYSAKNIVVSATGALNHETVIDLVQKKLGGKKQTAHKQRRRSPKWHPVRFCQDKTGEQVHMLLGFPVGNFSDELRFESYIVNTLLGGGMTSRLYQSVREKKGLVYSIYSSLHSHTDCGMLVIYAQTEPKNVKNVGNIVAKEIKKLRTKGVSKAEVEMFKTQVIGSIMLGSDDIENRMTSLAVNEMVFGEYKSVESVMAEIQRVNVDSVNHFIHTYLHPDKAAGVILGAQAESLTPWFNSLEF